MNSFQLKRYTQLIGSFLKNKISAVDFEREYMDSYLSDETDWPENIFWILDELFADVDAFCADATLRDEYDLDEAQLRNRCENTLNRLQVVVDETDQDDRFTATPSPTISGYQN